MTQKVIVVFVITKSMTIGHTYYDRKVIMFVTIGP